MKTPSYKTVVAYYLNNINKWILGQNTGRGGKSTKMLQIYI